jgi:DNA-binding IclR family transcriptional regulator
MTAAHPLPLPDPEFFPMDAAYLASLPPEIRAEIERAEEDAAEGRIVSRAEIEATLDEMRRDG